MSDAPDSADGERDDGAWRENFATTVALATRLDLIRRHLRTTGEFGLDVLARNDVHRRSVLEIGCGTGHHVVRFLTRTKAVPTRWVLLDISEEMAHAAREAAAPRCRVASAVVADAAELPFPRGRCTFDWIVAMHSLLFVGGARRALRGAARCLAPTGRALVTAPGAGDLSVIRRLARRTARERGLPWRTVAEARGHGATAIADVRAVFRRVRVVEQRGVFRFPDADTACRYAGTMAWLRPFGEPAHAAYVRAVRVAAVGAIRESGVFEVPRRSLTIVGSGPRDAVG